MLLEEQEETQLIEELSATLENEKAELMKQIQELLKRYHAVLQRIFESIQKNEKQKNKIQEELSSGSLEEYEVNIVVNLWCTISYMHVQCVLILMAFNGSRKMGSENIILFFSKLCFIFQKSSRQSKLQKLTTQLHELRATRARLDYRQAELMDVWHMLTMDSEEPELPNLAALSVSEGPSQQPESV